MSGPKIMIIFEPFQIHLKNPRHLKEICDFQNCIYNFFNINETNKNNMGNIEENILCIEYNHLLRRQVKKVLKKLKNDSAPT